MNEHTLRAIAAFYFCLNVGSLDNVMINNEKIYAAYPLKTCHDLVPT